MTFSVEYEVNKSKIGLVCADITTLEVDAIVNAAAPDLLGGGGVDGAIHLAAGHELLDACRALRGCRTGEAKITKAYKLPCNWVIHTVGPIYSGRSSDANLLKNSIENSISLALDYKLKSLVFSAISTGVYGYPKEAAAKIMLETSVRNINLLEKRLEIGFCLYSAQDFNLFSRNLAKLMNDEINFLAKGIQ